MCLLVQGKFINWERDNCGLPGKQHCMPGSLSLQRNKVHLIISVFRPDSRSVCLFANLIKIFKIAWVVNQISPASADQNVTTFICSALPEEGDWGSQYLPAQLELPDLTETSCCSTEGKWPSLNQSAHPRCDFLVLPLTLVHKTLCSYSSSEGGSFYLLEGMPLDSGIAEWKEKPTRSVNCGESFF